MGSGIRIYIDDLDIAEMTLGPTPIFPPIDYGRFRDTLAGGRDIVSARVYSLIKDSNISSFRNKFIRFYAKLSHMDFEVVLACDGPVSYGFVSDTRFQARRDPKHYRVLSRDLLADTQQHNYDTAIIVTKKHITGTIEEAKRCGKRVEVAFFEEYVDNALREAADLFISMDDMIDDIKRVPECL